MSTTKNDKKISNITINDITKYVESEIMNLLPKEEDYPAEIVKAMNYAMSAGGKRIRPTLLYLSYMMYLSYFNGVPDMIDREKYAEDLKGQFPMESVFMTAIEMIHTHSLIHDDLPALDNDTLRRGRATVHVEFSESTAILAGDALLNLAYELVSRSIMIHQNELLRQISFDKNIDNYAILISGYSNAMDTLLRKTGINGMLGGQALDVELSGQSITSEQRDYIYKNKTCALIEAPLMIGGILAGAGERDVLLLEEAGRALGMAFQVQDDILDVIGDAEKLGKEVHQDSRNEKNTYVDEFGIEESKAFVERKSKEAMKILGGLVTKNDALDLLLELIESMIHRES